MRYICLGYPLGAAWDAMSEDQRRRLVEESAAYEDQLRRSGNYVDGRPLRDGRDVTATLRFEGGRAFLADAESGGGGERLGGMMVLEARDLNHAIQLLSELPCMRPGGRMEIRPME
jgi:hypothetical protein